MTHRPSVLDRITRMLARQGPTAAEQTAARVVEDPEWAMASGVPVLDDRLIAARHIVGLVEARRHPTGWFVSARYRRGTPSEEVLNFRHFVTVRVYLLLRLGPHVGVWDQDELGDVWQAQMGDETRLLPRLVPDGVPLDWG